MPPKRKASGRTTSTEKVTKKAKTAGSSKDKETDTNMVKVVTKGGAAVDQYLPNKNQYRVFQKSGNTYSSTLNKADLQANNNKFYMIQIVQHESSGQLFTFNRWGRVGVQGQQAFKGPFGADMAIRDYQKKLSDKTRGGYTALEIKFDDDDEEDNKKSKKKDNKKPVKEKASKLGKEVQDLMKLIFDMNMINATMKEIGFDAKKCPLGRLGDTTIKQAYEVLKDLAEAIKKKQGQSVYSQLSGKFYTLIPHDFGFKPMSAQILDNSDKVAKKTTMLQSLSDMKLTTKMLDAAKNSDDTNKLDKNYNSLQNKIQNLSPSSQEYKQIVEWVKNADSHAAKKIKHIYTLHRDSDHKRYNNKLGNDQLLWHGSRLQNYVGILSQGLRIAPPEAPVNGYAYGKGVYFANSFSTSDCYCWNSTTNQRLILLAKVAVGRIGPLTGVKNHGPCIDTKKHDTCIGFDEAKIPDNQYTKIKGLKAPTKSDKSGQNAYIIYNTNQAELQYLIWYSQ